MSQETKIALLSVALDLKRVTTGYQNGSIKMSERFLQEALDRSKDIKENQVEDYMQKIIQSLPQKLADKSGQELAESSLMYSLLLQNYALAKS